MLVLDHARRFAQRVANSYRIISELPDKRRSLPRWAVFELLLRRLTPLAAIDNDGMRYLLQMQDRGVSRIIYMTGSFNLDEMEEAVTRLERALGRDVLAGRTFVDVGANIGTTTIPALHRFGAQRVVAFEPSPDNVRILSANLALNGLADRVDTVEAAVSDAAGATELELSPHNSGDHRIRTGAAADVPDAYQENSRDTITTPLVRLDDALADRGVEPADVGVLWIDTQGHEGHVLAGAPKLLAADVPVVAEYWPYALRRAGGLDLFHTLVADSFSEVYDIRADATLPAARVAELAGRYPGNRYADLILIP